MLNIQFKIKIKQFSDLIRFLAIFTALLLIYSCSASVDTRYSKEKGEDTEQKTAASSFIEDEFDITPYKIKLEIPEEQKNKEPLDLWFNYDTLQNQQVISSSSLENDILTKTAIDTIPGYRVEVASSDNFDEAAGIRSEIYFKTNEKAIYIIFEPPFYFVRVGDFRNIDKAKSASFKLNQLGFSGSRVVNDSIIIYK